MLNQSYNVEAFGNTTRTLKVTYDTICRKKNHQSRSFQELSVADCAERVCYDLEEKYGGNFGCFVNNHYFSDMSSFTGNA